MSAVAETLPTGALDVEAIRAEFPILHKPVHGKDLVYLDSGASAQKPRSVLEAIRRGYEDEYANVHRGAYWLSAKSTERYEAVREAIAGLLNAPSDQEIVLTSNTTDAINLVAHSYGRTFLVPGDEIVLSVMEHHANIVPWQMLAEEKGLTIRVVDVLEDGAFDMEGYRGLLNENTKLVAVTHTSNVLGTVPPVEEIIRLAHDAGAVVLLDGSQAVVHGPVDVRALDVDFYVFTGHKLYGPTGIGALYGKMALLEKMPPYRGGGDMIARVSFAGTTYREPPFRFEAGTPPIVQAIGLGAAIDFVREIGPEAIAAHEHDLLTYATEALDDLGGVTIHGRTAGKAALVSFEVDGVHAHDLATILDRAGVAVRAGHHCAQPLMERLGVAATARASFGMYNRRADVDRLVAAVADAQRMFA